MHYVASEFSCEWLLFRQLSSLVKLLLVWSAFKTIEVDYFLSEEILHLPNNT